MQAVRSRPGALRFLVSLLGAVLVLSGAVAPCAAQADAFYKGKTIFIYIGFAPGGSYDYFGRLLARYLGRHLPGNPNVVAATMPGAGSFTAANFLYSRAPSDGTALGIVSQTMAIEQALGTPGVQYKASRFNWIGRAASVNEVSFTFAGSKTKTIKDATTRETAMASTGAGSPSESYLKLLNAVAGTKFKLVGPYPASNNAMMAMERGEVDGAMTSYNTLQVSRGDWLRTGKLNMLVQYGEHAPELPNVPLAVELATTDEDRALLSFYVSSEQMGRSFLAPPDLPPERVAMLRTAYDETMQDPELLGDIKKSHVEFSPMSGDKVQRLVAETTNVSPAIVARIRRILDVTR